MDDYSFLDHVNTRLGEFIDEYEFSINSSLSQISPGFRENLLFFESRQCQIRIYLEHYRVYIEISGLNVSDPNLWYNIDVMACFVTNTLPSTWIYNLPRGVLLRQVIEQQLVRWQAILDNYFDKIIPLFVSKDKLYEMQKTLDTFVRDFYAEQQEVSHK
jgi:hypothetical protein